VIYLNSRRLRLMIKRYNLSPSAIARIVVMGLSEDQRTVTVDGMAFNQANRTAALITDHFCDCRWSAATCNRRGNREAPLTPAPRRGQLGQRRRPMPRTDLWLRFDDSHPGGHGARPLSCAAGGITVSPGRVELSADALDARGPRPGLSGPPGTDHRSIRGRRGRRCHRPGSCQDAGGGVGPAGDRGEPPGRRQHRSARAGRTRAPRRVHAADQHQRPGLQRRPGRRTAV